MGDTVTPVVYQQWRTSTFGSITERRELELILSMAGGLDGVPRYTTIGAAFIAVAAHQPELGGRRWPIA
ncbi:MAG TPA: hypothetical protein VGC03_11660 [Acidimicrobiia bacterium]